MLHCITEIDLSCLALWNASPQVSAAKPAPSRGKPACEHVKYLTNRSSLPPFEIDVSSLHPTHPSVTILATHVGVSLKGQTIAVNVVQKPVSKKDVELRLTQLGEYNPSQRNSMIDELSAASADDMTASDMSPKLVQDLRT
jgi:hypothetical protein